MVLTMKVNEFLNPKASLTPGIAGSLVMLISNTLQLTPILWVKKYRMPLV